VKGQFLEMMPHDHNILSSAVKNKDLSWKLMIFYDKEKETKYGAVVLSEVCNFCILILCSTTFHTTVF
jgi:hypothetical protein